MPASFETRRGFCWERRCADIAKILGCRSQDVDNPAIDARCKILDRLKAARRVEILRGSRKSWLYDVNRHLNLSELIRREHEALERLSSRTSCDKRVNDGTETAKYLETV